MNVLYLLFSFTVGGTEKLVTDICNEMQKNHKVYLYIINDYYDESMLRKVSQNVDVICYGRKPGQNFRLKAMLDLYLFCKKNRIQVIHCNSLDTPEWVLFVKLFKRKTRIVYTVHDVNQYAHLKKIRVHYRNLVCDEIVAISKSVYADLINNGARRSKTSIVYNAISMQDYDRQPLQREKRTPFIIGNVARIDIAKKGQDILVDAINILKEEYYISCLFAGAADEAHMEELERLKSRAETLLGNSQCTVSFLGKVDDIPTFLDSIDLFVLPSRYEGFGISLLEAMARGVPCISSDIDGPREIIGNNERGYLFAKDSPEKLAERIAYVIDNYDKALSMADKTKIYVRKEYSIENMCRLLEKLYCCDYSLTEK